MRRQVGFTLVELLVVIAIIALLISILLPSLESAQEQARSVVCAAHLHDIYSGANTYGAQFNDWLPGSPGTTGAELAVMDENDFEPFAVDTPGLPVQTWDWQTPLAYYGYNYSDLLGMNRAERWRAIRNYSIFQCPSNNFIVLSGYVPRGSYDDFVFLTSGSGWDSSLPMNSYSAIREFLYFGWEAGLNDGIHIPPFWGVRTEGHAPLLSRLKKPAEKVFISEGSRYIIKSGLASADYDVGWRARYGGAFAVAGPPSAYSRAYVNPLHLREADDPMSDRYTYRHHSGGDLKIQALFFDGHAAGMTKREAIMGVDQWYPSGTKVELNEFTSSSVAPKPVAAYEIQKRVPVGQTDEGDDLYPIY